MKKNTGTKISTLFIAAFIGLMMAMPASQAFAEKVHRLAIHVSSNDLKTHTYALNNIENVAKYYKDRGEKIIIELVAYGPGLHMLRSDTSKVKDRIEKISLQLDNVAFSACGNTITKMTKKAGKKIPIMPEAKHVPAGVVRLMELQESGWSYLRP